MSTNTLIIIVIIVIIIAGFLLFFNGGPTTNITPTTPTVPPTTPTKDDTDTTPQPITVTIAAQNNSSQSGSALLEEVDGQTKVTLTLSGEPTGASQPAHIHSGSCPTPGGVRYSLTNIEGGQSQTALNVSLKQLLSEGSLAINVHKSAAEQTVYVACGNIPASGSSSGL